ncbi:uncharacterized protein LOC143045322 [Mytilus galloprovincialis]|uniref:uncharacterized protein LOC143045322 n=1 Tax=Mytilus galloprovincialis TaxID=29158 RepID=UPI003F7B3786
MRAEEIQKLQEEIAILRTAIEPLVKKPLPRNFVKDPNRRNDDTPDVNRHSVANAYRKPKRGRTKDSGLESESEDENYTPRERSRDRRRRTPSPRRHKPRSRDRRRRTPSPKDEWNSENYDKKQKEKKQKEKQAKMPTDSEDDSDDSTEQKQQRRRNRQIAELF